MKFRERHVVPLLERALRAFPVVVVVGMRKTGKTTLVLRFGNGRAGARVYVTLDDLPTLAAAREDPQGFVDGLARPVTIDEVQRVPPLLLAIKRKVAFGEES